MADLKSPVEILVNPLPETEAPSQFVKELETLINRHSVENGSNTPDFILAEFLASCLEAFNACSRAREKWYGKELKII